MRTILYTALALVAFAANSVLCRLALRQATIDAASFSTIRLTAGAATLLLVTAWMRRRATGASHVEGSWVSAGMLFLYAVPFSFAYSRLNAGTGALILFGCVQLTMMIAALWSGERPHPVQWLGLALALGGLVYLVLPGLEAPSFAGAALMALAGFSWGVYSLRGRSAANPLAQTTNNFVRSVPLVLAVSLLTLPQFHIRREGMLLAVASGAIASGLGYVVWYAALRGLTATRAAVVQLLVPILAALGGVIFLAEAISWRLVISGVIVLGGIALALIGRERLRLTRNSSLRFSFLVCCALIACTGSSRDDAAPATDSTFVALQARGAQAMGVDQYTSSHVFESLPDGGRIVLQRDSADSAGTAAIRAHMRDIAARFASGDFTIPGMVHAQEVPGTVIMAAQRARIRYAADTVPRGGQVRITTTDPAAVAAVHAFLAFQRADHRASGHAR